MQLWGWNGRRTECEAAVVATLPATCLQKRPLSPLGCSLSPETHLDLAQVGANAFLPAAPTGFFMTALLGWNLYTVQFNHVKCAVQSFFLYSQSYTILEHFITSKKQNQNKQTNPLYPLATTPHSLLITPSPG